jgi:hypothetical protein
MLAVRVVEAGIVFLTVLTMTASVTAAQPLYPLVSGWQQWFRIDSQGTLHRWMKTTLTVSGTAGVPARPQREAPSALPREPRQK